MLSVFRGIASKIGLSASIKSGIPAIAAQLHTSAVLSRDDNAPHKFLAYNKKMYPPQEPGEEPRPAVIYFKFLK